MTGYRLTLRAAEDMTQIAEYVGKRSSTGAVTVLETIVSRFTFVGNHPHSGEQKPHLGNGVRAIAAGTYVIYFHPIDTGVLILRIYHGSRDIHSLSD